MDVWIAVGMTVGVAALATGGVLASRRNARAKVEPEKPVVVPQALTRRVDAAYGEWIFRLQGNCPWCRGGQFRAINRTMKVDLRDGSMRKNVVTQCSRCRWRVGADPDPLGPEHLAALPDLVGAPTVRWEVQTASGDPIAEITIGDGRGVQAHPSAAAAASNDPRIELATLLFRGACAVPLPGVSPAEARIIRGAAVQARIVRAQIAGMPRAPKGTQPASA